jgi:DNA-binding transcriptional regulator YhcF (GntR family)
MLQAKTQAHVETVPDAYSKLKPKKKVEMEAASGTLSHKRKQSHFLSVRYSFILIYAGK